MAMEEIFAKEQAISVIISARSDRDTRGEGVNRDNLHPVYSRTKWEIPRLLNLNARSLNTEKLDELQVVAHINRASCVCVTETWFQDYIFSVLSVLGSSDHNMVLLSPSDNTTLDNGSVLHVSTRCTGHFEKMEFAEELSIVTSIIHVPTTVV